MKGFWAKWLGPVLIVVTLAAVLIWRFMSYYLGLLLGAAANLIGRRRGI